MDDFAPSLIVIILGTVLVAAAVGFSPVKDRRLVMMSLGMHYVFSLASYWIMENVFVNSDVHAYVEDALKLKPLVQDRPLFWLAETFKLLWQLPSELPIEPGPTGSMIAITTLAVSVTESVWAIFLICTLLSFFGKWAIYCAFRDELQFDQPRPLLIAAMLIPSCVYWTSGLVKEAFAISGVALLFRGTQLLLRGLNPLSFVLLPIGVLLVAAFKPFFLFAFLLAAAVWVLVAKTKVVSGGFTPFIFVAVLGVAVVGLAVLGNRYREFSVDRVVETVAEHQMYAMENGAEGGSNYRIGDPNARSVGGQIIYAPVALVTTLARPLPFEVHNAVSGIASLELLVMTALLIQSLRRSGLKGAWRGIFGNPILVFAVIFTIIAATAVGLATTNFGTLSRYRTPILPFYAALILGMRRAAALVPKKAPAAPVRSAALARALAARPVRTSRPARRGTSPT